MSPHTWLEDAHNELGQGKKDVNHWNGMVCLFWSVYEEVYSNPLRLFGYVYSELNLFGLLNKY